MKRIVWFSASQPPSPDALFRTLKPPDLLDKRGIRFARCCWVSGQLEMARIYDLTAY